MNKVITPELLQSSLSFEDYLQWTRDMVDEKIPRTGIYVNDNTFRYTASNLKRMQHVLDYMVVQQKLYNLLSTLREEWLWVVLSEPWCGDASWGTPALYMLSACTDKITFRILLRDKHPEVMAAYQTAGTDSIPKLICWRKRDGKELGTWGPRPKALQQMVEEFRQSPQFDYRENVRKLHHWYQEDMTQTMQEELTETIKKWKAAGEV